jgi:hypothetical protein
LIKHNLALSDSAMIILELKVREAKVEMNISHQALVLIVRFLLTLLVEKVNLVLS